LPKPNDASNTITEITIAASGSILERILISTAVIYFKLLKNSMKATFPKNNQFYFGIIAFGGFNFFQWMFRHPLKEAKAII